MILGQIFQGSQVMSDAFRLRLKITKMRSQTIIDKSNRSNILQENFLLNFSIKL